MDNFNDNKTPMPKDSSTFSNLVWLLLCPNGRLNQKGFYLSFAIVTSLAVLTVILALALEKQAGNLRIVAGIGALITGASGFWILCMSVDKRLHDLGKHRPSLWDTLWCMAGIGLTPVFGLLFLMLIYVLWMLRLGVAPGNAEANKYGAPYEGLFPPVEGLEATRD